MSAGASTVEERPGCTIVSIREFEAPRERVFRAWVDSEELARWWGPKDFVNRFEAHDPVAGGAWRFVMRAPDGTEYPNESRYVEVTPPGRLVFDHLSGHRFRVTAVFEVLPSGGTRLEWTMVFEDPVDFEGVKPFVIQGNLENLERLAAVVACRA